MRTDIERIKARIRALRQMTEANGCTEAEAMQAAASALSLMQKHSLSDDDLAFVQYRRTTPGKRRQVIDSLWPHVARICRCKGWFAATDNGLTYVYFGREEDVLIAEYLHGLLVAAFRREADQFKASHEYKRRRKQKTRNASLRAFQQGMLERITRRLSELWWVRINSEGNAEAAALVERDYLKRLAKVLQEMGVQLSGMAALRRASSAFSEARLAGHIAGAKVPIDPGLSTAPRAQLEPIRRAGRT